MTQRTWLITGVSSGFGRRWLRHLPYTCYLPGGRPPIPRRRLRPQTPPDACLTSGNFPSGFARTARRS
jgi:hypothetical protein